MTKLGKRLIQAAGEARSRHLCLHCGRNGSDAYMLHGDLWRMVLPPSVEPSYAAGFICFRCALESIDRPLFLEDVGGCADSFPMVASGDGFDFFIRFPNRWRKAHAIHIAPWVSCAVHPVNRLISEYGWLLDRLAIQARRVVVRQDHFEGAAVTIGRIAL